MQSKAIVLSADTRLQDRKRIFELGIHNTIDGISKLSETLECVRNEGLKRSKRTRL